jgi:undecaprenyl-diphosphatase
MRGVVAWLDACRVAPGWTLLALATLGLSLAAAGDGVLPGDVAVSRAIQAIDWRGATILASAVNAIGGTLGSCLVAATLAYVCARRGQATFALVVLGALALRFGNALIKFSVDSPRPDSGLVQVTEQANGLGFPSAHVMGVVLLYGALLVLVPELIGNRPCRLAIQATAGLMLLAIGFGRIHAGAHWPSDVLGAYLYGVLGLAGLLALHRAVNSGRLPDPEPALRAALRRPAEIASAIARFLWPSPVRRPSAQPVSIRVGQRRRGE